LKKGIYIINSHSIVDLITNSSTEIFVCKTQKTLDVVNEILKSNKELTGYEEPWIFNLDEFREWRKKEKKRQNEWNENSNAEEVDWDNKFSNIKGYFYDIEDKDDLIYLRKDYIKNKYSIKIQTGLLKYKERDKWIKGYQKIIQNIYDEIKESKENSEWWNNPLKYYLYNNTPISELNGKIIIIGEGSNSIPFNQFEWIEDTFNAKSYHLG